MDLARWLQDDTQVGTLVTKLKDVSNPPDAVTGWTTVEMVLLTNATIRTAVFQV